MAVANHRSDGALAAITSMPLDEVGTMGEGGGHRERLTLLYQSYRFLGSFAGSVPSGRGCLFIQWKYERSYQYSWSMPKLWWIDLHNFR